MRPRLALTVMAVLTVCLTPHRVVQAQDLGIQAFGLRGGISMNPDQFHVGAFLDAGHLTDRLRFQPSFELGLGNGVRLATVNADALFLFAPRRFRPYAGGGLGLNFIDITNGVGQGRGLDIEPVLNLVGGVEWGAFDSKKPGSKRFRSFLIEGRLGIGDTPEFKLSAGVSF